nr:hypothetical protein [Tanacetum cinerariifolium]
YIVLDPAAATVHLTCHPLIRPAATCTPRHRRPPSVNGDQRRRRTVNGGGQRRSTPPTTSQRWRSTTVAGVEPPLTAAGPPLTTTGPPVNGGISVGVTMGIVSVETGGCIDDERSCGGDYRSSGEARNSKASLTLTVIPKRRCRLIYSSGKSSGLSNPSCHRVTPMDPQERVCDGAQLEFMSLHPDKPAWNQTVGQSDPKS